MTVRKFLIATYDSGWLAGKMETLAVHKIPVPEKAREEHLSLVNKRSDTKALLLAQIDDLFYGDKND
jgi:predicted HAD superfamily phosphohydrolase